MLARCLVGLAVVLLIVGSGSSRAAETPRVEPATATQILDAVREPGACATIVSLWATWCLPCVEEFPDLLELRGEYASRGLRLVLVSLDFGDDRIERVRDFLRERGADSGSYLKDGPDQEFVGTLDPEWSGILPATLVFDDRGERRALIEGRTSHERLAREIAPLCPPINPEEKNR